MVFFLLFGQIFLAPDACAKSFDLKGLVQYALQHSAAIKSSHNNLLISQLKNKNALYSFFPSLELDSVQGYQSELGPWKKNLTLSLSQSLYNNGYNLIEYSKAKKLRARNALEHIRNKNKICLEIFKEYANYSLLTHISDIQKVQYQSLLKQFRSIKKRYRLGEKARIDFLRFKARLQRAKISQINAQNSIDQSNQELRSVINYQEGSLALGPMTPDYQEIALGGIESILDNHFNLKIFNYQKKINADSLQMEKRKYGWKLHLSGNLKYASFDYTDKASLFSNDNFQLEALLTFSYPLWDWMTSGRNIAIKRMETISLDHQIDAEILTLKTQIQRLLLNINQQQKEIKLGKRLVDLEQNNYRSQEMAYHNGQASFLDLIRAIENVTYAKTAYYRDIFNLKTYLAQYQYHQGTLYENIIKN